MDALRPSDPRKIGSFTVVARLGSGGMGDVYLATRGVQRVALKVLNRDSLEEPSARERFLREAQSLEKVDSQRVSRLVDWSGSGDEQWLAMEFINGPNLRELVLSEGPFELEEWMILARGLLEALVEIHSKHIIHRDIKPGNVVMSERGPVVIDLGISQMMDATRLTRTGGIEGSPAWLAPEQLESEDYGIESDVFSLGSVLVFAGRGSSPWGRDDTLTVPVVFSRILNSEPVLDGLQHEQIQILSRMLVKSPTERASARELLDQLSRMEVSGEGQAWDVGPLTEGADPGLPRNTRRLEVKIADRTAGTRKVPRKAGKEDLEKTEYLSTIEKKVEGGRKQKTPEESLSTTGDGIVKKVGFVGLGGAVIAAFGGFGILLTTETSQPVTVKSLSFEWAGGDRYEGYTSGALLDDFYIVSGETMSRSSCLSSDVVVDYEGRRVEPSFQASQELASGGVQWLPISFVTYGELACPDGFQSVVVTLDPALHGGWSSEECLQIRYLEPESVEFPERQENWCILRTNGTS